MTKTGKIILGSALLLYLLYRNKQAGSATTDTLPPGNSTSTPPTGYVTVNTNTGIHLGATAPGAAMIAAVNNNGSPAQALWQSCTPYISRCPGLSTDVSVIQPNPPYTTGLNAVLNAATTAALNANQENLVVIGPKNSYGVPTYAWGVPIWGCCQFNDVERGPCHCCVCAELRMLPDGSGYMGQYFFGLSEVFVQRGGKPLLVYGLFDLYGNTMARTQFSDNAIYEWYGLNGCP